MNYRLNTLNCVTIFKMRPSTIFFLLFLSTSLVFAQTDGLLNKSVNVNFRNTSIEEILKSLETPTLSFVYSPEIFDVKKRVSINRQNTPLSQVLDELFVGQSMEMRAINGQVLLRKKGKALPPQPTEKKDTSRVETSKTEIADSKSILSAGDSSAQVQSVDIKAPEADLKDSIDSFGNQSARNSSELLVRTSIYFQNIIPKPYVGIDVTSRAYYIDFSGLRPRYIPVQPESETVWDQVPLTNKPIKTPRVKREREKPENYFRAGIASYTGYTQLDKTNALLLGGRLMYYPKASIGVGLAGNAMMSQSYLNSNLNSDIRLEGGYGGLAFEIILFPKSVVHLNIPLMIGAGGYSYIDANFPQVPTQPRETQAFFALEAGIELEFNVAKFMKIGLGTSYRDVSGMALLNPNNQQEIVTDAAFEGLSYGLILKFGKF